MTDLSILVMVALAIAIERIFRDRRRDALNNLTDREREILTLIEPGEALKESYRLEDGSIVTWQEVRNLKARSEHFKSKFSKQITNLFGGAQITGTAYTEYECWTTQKPPMAVKVAMAKEAIEQGLTNEMFYQKNMEEHMPGVTDHAEYDWYARDWSYAYSLAKDELWNLSHGNKGGK